MEINDSDKIQNTSLNQPANLKFRTPEELGGGSIFIQDDNGKVEMSDIKGSGSGIFMQELEALLKPAIDSNQGWSQELIDGVENLIIEYYKNMKNMNRYSQLSQALKDYNWPETRVTTNAIKWLEEQGVLDKHGNYIPKGVEKQESGTYLPSEKDLENIEKIFGGVAFADSFNDHNQMLDAIKYAENNGINLSIVDILINFDTHSDLYFNTNRGNTIADWVNKCLAEHPNIKDYYWVVPDNTVKDKEYGDILNGDDDMIISGKTYDERALVRSIPLVKNLNTVACLETEESIQTYYIDTKGTLIYPPKEEDRQELISEGFREIRIHICTKENLPNFKDKQVITSFDMDYFSNSGADTTTNYRDNKTAEEINQATSELLQTMVEKDIYPIIHANCFSGDDYLPSEDLKQAKEFADVILSVTPLCEDVLDEYKHFHRK